MVFSEHAPSLSEVV